MTEHAYELPPDDTAPADAVREAAAGEVVYLTRGGTPIAAVVPADAAAYLEALEDAADVIAARRARPSRSGRNSALPAGSDRPPVRTPVPARCATAASQTLSRPESAKQAGSEGAVGSTCSSRAWRNRQTRRV